jgi:toxin ParE1/3/4
MKIAWSPLAVDRASEIAGYIAEDNPTAAENWVKAVFTKVARLESFPESGRIVPEIDNPNFREIVYGNYRIIYRVEGKRVSVLTIRHVRQVLPVEEISK